MRESRKPIRTAFTVVSALGVIAVLHEFGVKYAEQKGWYDDLPNRVEAALNWLVALSEPLWFKIGLAFVAGITTGLWLDAFLRKREQRSAALPAAEIDKEALALEAEAASAKLLALVAQFESRRASALHDNRRDPEQAMMRMGEVEGQVLERYFDFDEPELVSAIVNVVVRDFDIPADAVVWRRGTDGERLAS